ncbi:recombinase zinc beta ribbon domain-containing protein [Streptomyces sp. BRA346]|uniref:recombinase zinc beta ribbon domain-containing protein n=1 Tax=Streptomyces sp. BRA346 TaxID=2878199 RepID=UPI004064206F
MLPTVRAILANPRYTGHQVWNRQRTDHDLIDAANTTLGHRDVTRWNTTADWIISAQPAHPALVREADFIAVQHLSTARETAPGRIYLLAGLLRCGVCGRRMESRWARRRPAYRCRHGHTSATGPMPGRTPNTYLREDHVLPHLPALLLRLTHDDPDGAEPMALIASAAPLSPADAVAHLRSEAISLTYDPAASSLTADTPRAERITIG